MIGEIDMWKRSLGLIILTCTVVLFVRALADEAKPAAPPEVIILSGNPMGSVKFRHRLHTDVREIQCITCHHASKPEHPATAPEQACSSCHVSVAVKPMVTNFKAAFHNADATAGLCISCHKKENAEHKHKLAPVACTQCHNKANVLPDPTAGN
jgi:DNA-directed RNA polymerase subunit RPC12/RpoP